MDGTQPLRRTEETDLTSASLCALLHCCSPSFSLAHAHLLSSICLLHGVGLCQETHQPPLHSTEASQACQQCPVFSRYLYWQCYMQVHGMPIKTSFPRTNKGCCRSGCLLGRPVLHALRRSSGKPKEKVHSTPASPSVPQQGTFMRFPQEACCGQWHQTTDRLT